MRRRICIWYTGVPPKDTPHYIGCRSTIARTPLGPKDHGICKPVAPYTIPLVTIIWRRGIDCIVDTGVFPIGPKDTHVRCHSATRKFIAAVCPFEDGRGITRYTVSSIGPEDDCGITRYTVSSIGSEDGRGIRCIRSLITRYAVSSIGLEDGRGLKDGRIGRGRGIRSPGSNDTHIECRGISNLITRCPPLGSRDTHIERRNITRCTIYPLGS